MLTPNRGCPVVAPCSPAAIAHTFPVDRDSPAAPSERPASDSPVRGSKWPPRPRRNVSSVLVVSAALMNSNNQVRCAGARCAAAVLCCAAAVLCCAAALLRCAGCELGHSLEHRSPALCLVSCLPPLPAPFSCCCATHLAAMFTRLPGRRSKGRLSKLQQTDQSCNTQTGTSFTDSFIPSCPALLQVLLGRRSKGSRRFRGLYEFPGGKVGRWLGAHHSCFWQQPAGRPVVGRSAQRRMAAGACGTHHAVSCARGHACTGCKAQVACPRA